MAKLDGEELTAKTLSQLIQAGAQKAQVQLVRSSKHELNIAANEMSLYRTTLDTVLELTAYLNMAKASGDTVEKCGELSGSKKSSMKINQLDAAKISEAVAQTIESARSSQYDAANDIAEYQSRALSIGQKPLLRSTGPEKPDFERMYQRLHEFIEYANTRFPYVNLMEGALDFYEKETFFLNSNGLQEHCRVGNYNFQVMITAVKEKNRSSFNYSEVSMKNLDQNLFEMGSFIELIDQSQQQLSTQRVPENFVGDIVITPDCMVDFLSFIIRNLSDYSLYTKTSIFTDKLHQKIAHDSFTLQAKPVDENMGSNEFLTEYGYAAKNQNIIEDGILNTYLLTLYGAKKTGLPRSETVGTNLVIVAGNKKKEDIIHSIRKGILLCRFSGGEPSSNGDFSGIAKNSFYIENGEIKFPITETMISGNFARLLFDIQDISSERINFGSYILPWIHAGNVQISTK